MGLNGSDYPGRRPVQICDGTATLEVARNRYTGQYPDAKYFHNVL